MLNLNLIIMGNKGIKIDEIIKLYNEGLQPVEIAEQLNCAISNITKRLKNKD